MWEEVAAGSAADEYTASLTALEADTRYRLKFTLQGVPGGVMDSVAMAVRASLQGFLPPDFTVTIEGDDVVCEWTQGAA